MQFAAVDQECSNRRTAVTTRNRLGNGNSHSGALSQNKRLWFKIRRELSGRLESRNGYSRSLVYSVHSADCLLSYLGLRRPRAVPMTQFWRMRSSNGTCTGFGGSS
ncbi:hypothetical protein PHSY_002184 [Pseudozyma hubeiensis SY62]|uniref:Uncharacterized protein n=1 Tax=Pseudozyma hubeiensis (strain SY62) TaxID=1305764 RepID=R9P0E9_PSEHS|nr:hypothetical protein PHSY_002184 [Pseudozyma hubeiensis SY62]GAC94611.1 hypothetical protein PHSY_002184 [Pseudozyma hubeiensis SY62]